MVVYTGGENVAIFTKKQIINRVSLGLLRGVRLAVVGVLQWKRKLSSAAKYISCNPPHLHSNHPPTPVRLCEQG